MRVEGRNRGIAETGLGLGRSPLLASRHLQLLDSTSFDILVLHLCSDDCPPSMFFLLIQSLPHRSTKRSCETLANDTGQRVQARTSRKYALPSLEDKFELEEHDDWWKVVRTVAASGVKKICELGESVGGSNVSIDVLQEPYAATVSAHLAL
ncbi:hypothetical protein C8Q80DRAFT_331642 [Daedaleopsis nitida]|nr:hypothetical protein C8Q80DRAFT_331642 [Daedaleopsis nitida]